MSRNLPFVSVIIPTHNRSASLQRTLDALRLQTYPLQQVEVVVVADGCTDETIEIFQHYKAPFTLQVINQPSGGPAAARNSGASKAKGQLLIFLDDDIQAAPGLIEAHVRAHPFLSNQVVIGYLPPSLLEQKGFFPTVLRDWWEKMFQNMHRPDHRFTGSDLCSGNFSLEAALFARVGGFNTTLSCHEDYELGMRLIKAGADFNFAATAWGYHHENPDIQRALQRKYQEGQADVMLARLYPELQSILPLAPIKYFSSPFLIRMLWTLVSPQSAVNDVLATHLGHILHLMERVRFYRGWKGLLHVLYNYWYWRGVVGELGTWQSALNLLQDGSIHTDVSPQLHRNLSGMHPIQQSFWSDMKK